MDFGASLEHCPLDVTWTGYEALKGLPVTLPAQVTICTLVTAQLMACGKDLGQRPGKDFRLVPSFTASTWSELLLLGSWHLGQWKERECEVEVGAHT